MFQGIFFRSRQILFLIYCNIEKRKSDMINEDTIYLLRESNSGTQMAVYSIDEILEKVNDKKLGDILRASKQAHEEIGDKLHAKLHAYGDETKDPGLMAKSMSWMKTNMTLAMEDSDRNCADLITTGCDMGIKTLYRHLNQYAAAEETAQEYCKRVIELEEKLRKEMQPYL